ncbi:ComF family protein [Sneathiella sp.]|uniref:ComF family protein n=1 Tax=Sneathiella sp. TaxID=1964365 RepID=UPI003562023E
MTHISNTGSLFTTARKMLLDAVFPAACVNCADFIDEPGNLCLRCWPQMTYISAPFCSICGFPFEFDRDTAHICGNCIRRRPAFGRARAVLQYDDASRDMVLGYKHSDKTDRVPAFANWMYRAGVSLVNDCDIICPVPLHSHRLIKRRFNQSALLARQLSKLSAKPVSPDMLIRTRPTRSQGGLSARARHVNVQGVFQANPDRLPLIEKARILLIDDVLTTGATVEACCNRLLRAGATEVNVLTFSRVVRPSNTAI